MSSNLEDACCIHDLIEAQGARTPDSVALAFGPVGLTYRELLARTGRVAAVLRSLGVGPDTLVGLAAERSLDLVCGALGILRAGGAYVPLDPGYPAERLAWIWEDARRGNLPGRPGVLLTQRALAGLLPDGDKVFLDELEDVEDLPAPDAVRPDNTAYVIYTSGSTGRPKGVVVPHRGVVNVVREAIRLMDIRPEDRVLQLASLGFDASVLEIFTALIHGACVVVTPRETLLSGEALGRELREQAVTTMILPPSLLDTLPAGMEDELVSLRSILVGGEACSAATAARWSTGGRRMINAYAPTEATVFATASFCSGHAIPTLGGPIENLSVHLMDQDGEAVAGEGDGELCLGGVGVVRGYLNRPELTAERFIPDPFSTAPGARLYRSGDLARRLPDGDLLFLGRVDFQVKIRGVRIELGEIEAVLGEHDGVQTAVVVAREDGGAKRLVGYVVRRDPSLTVSALRAFLAERLPEAMVPAAFLFLESMPMTPTGKVDRRALPAPGSSRPELDTVWTAPRGATEESLARIWGELLGIDGIGALDSLFELGGHSLLAAQIVTRVREELGVDLPLPAVFEHPTVAALASRIDRLRQEGGSADEDLPPLVPAPHDGPIPLSFTQERVWFLNQLSPGNYAYNFQFTVRFRGPLRPAVLEATFTEIIRRHEVLRTAFPAVDGGPVQVIHEPWEAVVPVIDLRLLTAAEREAVALRIVLADIRRPFDLERLPLLRWLLLKLDEEDHLLLHVEHHFVHDGWSLAVFLREMKELYTAIQEVRPSPLPEPPVQYRDFVLWQRRWLQGDALARQLDWWKERLAGSPPVLELAADRPRSRTHSFLGGALRADLPRDLYAGVRAAGRREGVTLFMTSLAAFQALLYRYTGQEDILLGSGIANRRLRELEEMIGMVVNTVVLRTAVEGGLTFRELAARARRTMLEAQAHQDLPFEKLVEELQPDRELSRNPLFQVLFSFHDSPVPDLDFAGMTGELYERHNGSAKSDLNVVAKPRAEQRLGFGSDDTSDDMTFIWEYSGDLFERATIDRMWSHYQALLAAFVEDPGRRISDLPLLTVAERRQLQAWGDGPASQDAGVPVHLQVAAWAERTPDALALAGNGVELSYAGLMDRARELAGRLTEIGVGQETVVAVLTERSPEAVVAALGTMLAGGAWLPLDPSYPKERLRFLLEDSGARAVVAKPEHRALLPETPLPVLDLSIGAGEGGGALSRATGEGRGGGSAAYVIYTSGSTGRPKGVVIPHDGLANLAAWHVRTYGVTPADRATMLAGPAFDASVWEVWPYLAAGASVHVPDAETRSDPRRLLDWMASERITLAFLPTPLAEALVEIEAPAGLALRALLTGGDRLRHAPARPLPFALVNHYGPTESTVVTTAGPVEPGRAGAPSIGRPIGGLSVRLLDRDGRRVPPGVPGELTVGGVGLARGYLGRPDLTAERFVPDGPDENGGRLYRTGDLARWRSGGELEFLGRIDHQVKIRGFRIELGEIEAVLAGCPGVREAVVAVRERDGDPVLVAYVVGEGAFESYLSERLPAYMVPSAFVVLPALPLTPNGKVDLRALPSPAWGDGEESGGPRTPLEETLAGIWGAVLGVEVGVHDNFFKLGGHSLIATRLLSRVRDAAGVEVPLSALFEAPTVAGLARTVEESMRGSAASEGPIPRRAEDETAPLSFSQERLWFLDQLTPGLSAYHIARAFRLSGPLDVDALARAAAGVVRRHEALRTTFTAVDGQPAQVIHPPEPPAVPFLEISIEANTEAEADRLLREETRKPFDLAAGPLLRLTVLRLGPDEHRLLLTMHHIVSDGWSMGIFFRELSALYRGEEGLAELPIQYADYAVWQRERLSGGRLAALLAHWKEELAGAPALLELPADRPRPAVQSWRGSQVEIELPPGAAAGLREQARRSGATLFMSLLAGLGALCARYTSSDDVVLGSPVAGRNHSETEGLIGLFVNNLVLRLRWQGDPAFAEIVGRARRATLTAHAHQDLPFEKLVAELAPERSLGHTPFFQVVLSTQSRAAEALDLPGIAPETLPVDRGESRFDLEVAVLEGGADEGLRLLWRYDRDLFDAATAERMAGHFATLLGAAAADPGRRLSELPLLAAEESAQLLAWNAGAEAFPPAETLHGLFAARAARSPEAVAAICEGASLTYAELDAGANRLARFLAGLGVRPGDLVGLCLERSLDLVTAVLGVLEAGAAYLPLDPSHPKERLAFALEDSRVAVLLTQESLGDVLPPTSARVVRLDTDREKITRQSPEPLDAGVTPGFPAYVIYTSGSTGRPKGVIVTHANVVRLMAATDGWFGFGPDDVWTLFHSYAFDFSVWELWGALLYGGRLVVVPYWVSRSPEAFLELLVRERVTVLNQTPSAFRQLVWAEETVSATAGSSGLALRHVVFGGEALELASLAPWYDRHPEDAPRLVNMYGITETTVHVTYRPLSRRDVEEGHGSVIGRAIPDLSLRVLDADLRPQPIGVPGEIHVGGPGLAIGYLGRPELTAERFVPDPFGPPGSRVYRSGDLARYRPDGDIGDLGDLGDLEYLGRIDHQVKIRGFRIELGEIETALASQPGVREAVVLAREDSPGEKRLVAYLVAEPPVDPDALRGRLVTALADLLPEYMIPAAFVTLAALPLTGNGKVDRRALPRPESEASSSSYVPPESPEQERLARIWSEVLGVERVGIHDDFFRLGGHSLLATRVMAQVRRAFAVDLPLRSLFQAPTVDGLSRAVREAGASHAPRSPRIEAASRAAHRRVRPADQGGPA